MGIYSTYLSSHQEKNNSFIQYNSKAHLEPSQTSQMELFVKMVNNWKSSTVIAKSSDLNVWLGSEYTSVITYKSLWIIEKKMFS